MDWKGRGPNQNAAILKWAYAMSKLSKLGIVLAGYAAAAIAAFVICSVVDRLNRSPDSSGGMQAFGVMLGCLGLFGLLALIPTALALYYLRAFQKFWNIFPLLALAVAAAGLVAALMLSRTFSAPWAALIFGFLGLLKVLAAPLFGLAFLICTFLAPTQRSRRALLAAAVIEFAVGAYGFLCLLIVGHWIF